MKAEVILSNLTRGMFAAEMDNGEYVIFELLDNNVPELGDLISHTDFYNMGGETFKNITQNNLVGVYVQNICGARQVRQLCML